MFHFIRKTLINRDKNFSAEPVERQEKTRIAAGVILLEAAYADDTCTAEELDHVIETLRSDFKLSEEQARDLVDLAYRERKNAVDLFEFTNHINNEFSKEEKKAVLQAVWRIIHIDGQLEKHEDYFARKLTHLLRLAPDDMIAAKLQARKELQ
jgi:uncharacterized tellurite resistance protein B-like protein